MIYCVITIIPYFKSVEKYELTPEAYSKRTDTVQSYLKRNNMGKYNEEEMKKFEERKLQQLEEEKQITANFKIGDRCEIDVPGAEENDVELSLLLVKLNSSLIAFG